MPRMFVNQPRPRLRPKAHRYNRRFSKALRWDTYHDRIRRVTGAASDSPGDFANAVQDWQSSKGLKPDGVLGPATWKRMRPIVVLEPLEPPTLPPPSDSEPAADATAPEEPPATDADPPTDADPGDAAPPAAGQDEAGIGFRGRRNCSCPACRHAAVAELQEEVLTSAISINRKSPVYVRWYQQALNRIQDAGLSVDGRRSPRTRAAVRRFQASSGLPRTGSVGPKTESALIRAGAGNPPSASPAPVLRMGVDTPLPTSAVGLYSYKPQERQFGTARTIEAILSIGQRWAKEFPNGPAIGIGDISLQGGGKIDGHVSHRKGVDFDVRLMRTDAARRGVTIKSPDYSRELTQKLVDLIRANGVARVTLIFNNDPSLKGVRPWPHHDDHLHVRFAEQGAAADQESSEISAGCSCMACRHAAGTDSGGEYELGEAGVGINRKSSEYIRWYQGALKQLLPAPLKVDGRYGPKTRSAVRRFQQRAGLRADGVVGPLTEAALVQAGAPQPPQGTPPTPQPQPQPQPSGVPCGPAASLSQAERDVLAVTSTLEGGKPFHCAVSGVDGISMGSMQWNLKAGTLQNMLTQFEKGAGRLAAFFGPDTERLKRLIDLKQTPIADAVAQATAEGLAARWRTALTQVCADPYFCQLQQRDIASRLCTAWDNLTRLGLGTVRGLSMCYDIINGDGSGAMAKVRVKALAQPAWSTAPESAKLAALANLAADRLGKYREERRARRLNIANIRTLYRKAPATAPNSFADQINSTVPGLDRAVSTTERTACNPAPKPTPPGLRPQPPAPPSPGESACPTPGEMAAGCQSNKRCSPIPDLVCLRAVGNVPIDYLRDFTKDTPKRGVYNSAKFKMRPGVRNSIARFLAIAGSAGLPVERILSQGAYLCRCQRNSDTLSNHGRGEAIDVGGVKVNGSGREILAINFQNERPFVRRLDACLRLAFPRVIDYNYNTLHHDHFHCEISIPLRRPKERSTLLFVQELLGVPLSGTFDLATRTALASFGATPAELRSDRGLNAVYDRLFLRAAQGGI